MLQYAVRYLHLQPPDKILSAIKAVDNGEGVLLVVKNYAGDVMNFEMAQEMAEMEDIQVETVVVKDDIAVSDEAQRRGVSGTVFVHKIAGYLAEKGTSLPLIKEKLNELLPNIKSIGMALTPPLVPTTGQYGFDIDDESMEIGIGIHGEKGLAHEKFESVDIVVERLIAELLKEVEDEQLIVMINGMGATPLSELNIATKYVAQQLEDKQKDVKLWFVGDYMTSLDMEGLSITFLPYTEAVYDALTAPTSSPYFNV
ncbi:dihydroxyacetone kinase subunit DhaK [Staphylococcus cohnii]|nr:dihydroxyacetone kinase subunit DhaK [Staphylococcus cohnii]